MTVLLCKNYTTHTYQLFDVENEQDVLFDHQLASFFADSTPIEELPFSGGWKPPTFRFLHPVTMDEVRLANNPFQLTYPVAYREFIRSPFVQHVSASKEGAFHWEFELMYQDGNEDYIGHFLHGFYSLNHHVYKENGMKNNTIKWEDRVSEQAFYDALFTQIRRDRLPRLLH